METKPKNETETVMLSKNKIRFQLAEKKKELKEMLLHIGIHYQTWGQRETNNTWPVFRAIMIAEWIGCKVSDLQSDCSMVVIKEN